MKLNYELTGGKEEGIHFSKFIEKIEGQQPLAVTPQQQSQQKEGVKKSHECDRHDD